MTVNGGSSGPGSSSSPDGGVTNAGAGGVRGDLVLAVSVIALIVLIIIVVLIAIKCRYCNAFLIVPFFANG